jgi:hypothetical protein
MPALSTREPYAASRVVPSAMTVSLSRQHLFTCDSSPSAVPRLPEIRNDQTVADIERRLV